jgi:hypothetical protein
LPKNKIAENHYLDVSMPSTGKRKIAATVDFANPEWYSVIFGISTNKSYKSSYPAADDGQNSAQIE